MLEGFSATTHTQSADFVPTSNNSISAAKLLENVESSKYPGKKLLDRSKIVDENGEPLKVYHGTNDDFYIFDKKLLGLNTDDNASDEDYAKTAHLGFWFTSEEKGIASSISRKMIPCFLNIRYPEEFSSLAGLAEELGYHEEVQNLADEWGVDGFILKRDEEFGGRSYVATSPNQIKSATENNGDFSADNDDIRYSIIGEKGALSLDLAEEQEPKPIGHGAFGDIYDQFKGKPQEAISFLIKKKGGEALVCYTMTR